MRRVTTHGTWLLVALAAAGACVALIAPAHGGPADTPPRAAAAQWRPFDLLVELHDLPRAYTCTELWYRFRDVLMAVGARPWPQILTYHCDSKAAGASRSPSAQLRFELPDLLPPSQSRYADVTVERGTLRLGPGKLESFTTADCELLKQMDERLLIALPVRVVGTLSCPRRGAPEQYALEVQALLPHS